MRRAGDLRKNWLLRSIGRRFFPRKAHEVDLSMSHGVPTSYHISETRLVLVAETSPFTSVVYMISEDISLYIYEGRARQTECFEHP